MNANETDPSAPKSQVSVIVPVKNEASNIEACLHSLEWADEVVVVDSHSTDGTAELAADLGARVVQFDYRPGGAKKKNWTLAQVALRNDWVLILDADERVTPELALEIRAAVQSTNDLAGYYINRRFYFLNTWVRHAGYYPSWNLRLLRTGKGKYEAIPDWGGTSGDNEVHEHILLDGEAGYLKHPMDHFAYPSVAVFLEKHNRYSNWEARVASQYLVPQEEQGKIAPHLRLRRRLKRIARAFPFPHWLRFTYHYFVKRGFLDGWAGYILSHLLAEYEFLIWAKTRELATQAATTEPARQPTSVAPRVTNPLQVTNLPNK
jgi:glycosyltransferase involved in cell wall biosynthesis